MVMKMRILLKMLVFVAAFSRYNADQTVRMVVPSQDWYTAAVGSNFTARCESDGPVVWRKRGVDLYLTGDITKDDNRYISKLVLKNLKYQYVEVYDCLPLNGTSTDKASFYLYVDDPVQLTLSPDYMEVHSKSYQPAVVPCRPSAPDVFVKLLTSTRDLMANSTTRSPGPDEKGIYFDPHRGFIMPAHLMQPAWFIYICEFSKRGVIQDINIDLYTSGQFQFLDNEVADPKWKVHAKPGDTVVLPVEVFTDDRPNNMWAIRYTDGEVVEIAKSGFINERSNKIRVEDTDGYPWGTKVVIHDVNENDEGDYVFTSYTESGLHLISKIFHVSIEEDTGELSMEIPKVIKVQDYKSLQAFCFKSDGRKSDGRKFKAKWSFRPLDCTDKVTESCEENVSIVNPLDTDERSYEDLLSAAVLEVPRLGNLTCAIYFDDGFVETVTKPVVLSEVEEGFEVRRLSEKVEESDTVTLQCVASKYLYSDHLYWISPEGHVIEGSDVSDTGDYAKLTKSENEYSFLLELGIKNFNQSRDYRCMAVNNDHKPEFKTYSMTAPVPVTPQFFAKLGNNTLLVPSTSTVTLICDRVQTRLVRSWFKDGVIISSSYETRLEIKNVTSNDSGKYTCRLDAAVIVFEFTQVIVYEPDAAKSEDIDMEIGNGLKADTSEQAAVHCQLYGQPSSKVEWYKNGEKLPGSPQQILYGNRSMLVIYPMRAKDAGLYSCKPIKADTDASLDVL